MSVIPEIVLHNVIVRGLREIRKDPRILDVLFKNLDQSTLQSMKDVVLNQSINFTINYPRADSLKLPTISLLLKTERESQTFLGDIMGASPHYGMPDQEHTIDTLGGHAGSETDAQGLPRLIVGGIRVEELQLDGANNTTTVIWPEAEVDRISSALEANQGVACFKLIVSAGTGAGQEFMITRISSNSLDIEGTFDPQLDSSSLLDIREVADTGLAIGEPSRVYPAGATNFYRRGANFAVQYQLSIMAGHQDEVLYLYSVLKGLLFSQKMFMEEQGMYALQVTGSDFAPRTEFLPSEVFQRVLTIDFIYPFSFLQEQETFTEIQLRLRPTDTNTLEPCEDVSVNITFESETTV